jgi:2-methylisocitrate lyase-like PEP mutase family enzyme
MTRHMTTSRIFRELHAGPELLVLANCWDGVSARLIESIGARALATTSAGVAWSLGYPDGDRVPLEELTAAVRAMVRVVRLPLSVDLEGGYAEDPAEVGHTVAAIVDAGAVGINLEDGVSSPDLLAAKIAQAKQVAARRGVDLFVNARTDVYLRKLVPDSERVAEVVARAARYREAGADGLFVPRLVDAREITDIVSSVGLPLNVLASAGLPPAAELQTFGVRRLSAGSSLAQAAWGRVAALGRAFLGNGSSEPLSEEAYLYADLNALFTRR